MRLRTRSMVLLMALTGWVAAQDAVPARPMIIHGAAIVEGHVPDSALTVTLNADGKPLTTQLQLREGQAWYRLVVDTQPAAPMAFDSVGDNNLGTVPPVQWQEGGVVRVDLVAGVPVLPRPELTAAAATVNGDAWSLSCQFTADLAGVSPDNASFQVQWYLQRVVPVAPATTLPDPLLLKQDTLAGSVAANALSTLAVTHQVDDVTNYELHVLVTPLSVGDHVGPAAWRQIVPIPVAGDI